MNASAIPAVNIPDRPAHSAAAGSVQEKRGKYAADNTSEEATTKNGIQPEELLQNIKALTENGLYSVRFEMNHDTRDLIINLVDYETGEVIRQIPPEDIINLHEYMEDLRGNIVSIES